MRYKFHVGQVVRYKGDVYEISSHYREGGIIYYMLKLQNDTAFDNAEESDLKKLTKRQAGR